MLPLMPSSAMCEGTCLGKREYMSGTKRVGVSPLARVLVRGHKSTLLRQDMYSFLVSYRKFISLGLLYASFVIGQVENVEIGGYHVGRHLLLYKADALLVIVLADAEYL